MKLKNIIWALGATLALGACSADYLSTSPESSADKSTMCATTDNAKLAMNGIMRSMYRQYLSTQGANGEGTMKYWFGDWQGDDVQVVAQTGWASLYNSNYIDNNSSIYNYYMWYYYYKLIGNSNTIIVNIDNATGPDAERNFIKAQALAVRAFSYTRLSEYYCPRWSERTTHPQGLVLRLDESAGELAPSSQEDVYKQIYADLDEAISLFKSSGLSGKDMYGSNYYVPTLNFAYGVYARAALYREDWANAANYAKLARTGTSLMGVSAYVDGGFNTPNAEWILCSDGSSMQALHYYGFFSYNGSSSSSSASRTYPKAISKELYEQIPASDVRKNMFLDPSTISGMDDPTVTYKSGSKQQKAVIAAHPGKIYSTSTVASYMQFKFQGVNGAYNVGDPCHMRASEMYLIEAEALARQGGKDAQVRQLLTELVKDSGRDPEFETNLSGADLLAQVQLYRRIELWGEGFRWYDLKRNNQARIRKAVKDGGSFAAAFCVNLQPTDKNNWVYVYPLRETDYNDAFKDKKNPDKTEK